LLVARTIDLAHSTRAEPTDDAELPEAVADHGPDFSSATVDGVEADSRRSADRDLLTFRRNLLQACLLRDPFASYGSS